VQVHREAKRPEFVSSQPTKSPEIKRKLSRPVKVTKAGFDVAEKPTIMGKFWQSSLGKRLPIGGPMRWFRLRGFRHRSQPASASMSARSHQLSACKRRSSLWSSLRRRFIWKTTSRRRRSSSGPDGQEDAAKRSNHSPVTNHPVPSPTPHRHAPSRQFVWKTRSSSRNIATADTRDDCDVIELSSTQSSLNLHVESLSHRQESRPSKQRELHGKRQRSPFFSSRYIWRSENGHKSGSSQDRRGRSSFTCFDRTSAKRARIARQQRRFLWKSDPSHPTERSADGNWREGDAVLDTRGQYRIASRKSARVYPDYSESPTPCRTYRFSRSDDR